MESKSLLYLSDTACAQVEKMLEKHSSGSFLRLCVEGGGCAGFQYIFTVDSAMANDDYCIKKGGAQVVVDPISIGFVEGSLIDYEQELIRSGFVVKNPNAVSDCGCGNSFSI